jgi:hypothetical protein
VTPPPLTAPLQLAANPTTGNQLILNGKTYPGYWSQEASTNGTPGRIAISDGDLIEELGVNLLDTSDFQRQPLQWYSTDGITAEARFPSNGMVRFVDISGLARQFGWQVGPQGNALVINSGAARVSTVRSGRQTWGRRIVLTLDRPAPWRITELTNSRNGQTARSLKLVVDATLDPASLQGLSTAAGNGLGSLSVKPSGNQTQISASLSGSMRPEVSTLSNPPRLVIDIRADPTRSRAIAWGPGIQWRESVVTLGTQQFPLTWVAMNPRQPGVTLQPIWGNQPTQLVGTHPLISTALRSQAAVAINAGFFDRKQQTPLGAIRQNGTWISSPILNRGVIAWNNQGQFTVGRINLAEQITTGTGQALTIVSRDSGYPQRGIARYTPTWGGNYTPFLPNEQIITVVNDQVVSQVSSTSAPSFPIPRNGYLLVARDFPVTLTPGAGLRSQTSVNPPQFEQYPNILGAGPLLVANGQVVLNIPAEKFQTAFEAEAAPRSAIAQTQDGTILLAVCHNRVGGAGPSLQEWARILQQIGGVNVLNLDGGSSTTLYLGGRLIDRHPVTQARVQNGLGIFLRPAP